MKELILDVKFGDPQLKNLQIPKISSAKLANRKKKKFIICTIFCTKILEQT